MRDLGHNDYGSDARDIARFAAFEENPALS
jgi:hypothetical protein